MKEILHIGFSKCASTFLQSLFSQNKHINYIYKSKRFSRLNEPKKAYKLVDDKTNLESDEHIVLPSYSQELNTHGTILKDVKKTLEEIYKTNSDIKIILVIRNQLSLIKSRYSQYVLGGGAKSFEEFTNILIGDEGEGKDYYQNYYFEIIRLIEDTFSKDQLHLIYFEEIGKRKGEIVQELGRFIGVDLEFKDSNIVSRRKGLTQRGLSILRKLNSLIVTDNKNLFNVIETKIPEFIYIWLVRFIRAFDYYFPSRKIEIDTAIYAKILEKFHDDNSKLSDYYGTDLSKMGYL